MRLTSQPLQTANQGLWSQNKQTLLIKSPHVKHLNGTGAKPKQESYSFQKYIMWQRTIRRHHLPFHALIQLLVKLLCWEHAKRMHPEPLQKSGYPTIHIPWTLLTCHNLLFFSQKAWQLQVSWMCYQATKLTNWSLSLKDETLVPIQAHWIKINKTININTCDTCRTTQNPLEYIEQSIPELQTYKMQHKFPKRSKCRM